jgi:two-component system, NarL family, invasion response regulator UvrY
MNQSRKLQILLADDHRMFREGLKKVLSESSAFVVAGEAGNAQDALQKVRTSDFDLVILDISMPGMDGIDVLKQIKQMKPHLHVLILSMHPEDQYAFRAIKGGASGYLTKDKATDELIEAIRRIASGRRYISPDVAEQLAIDIEKDSDRPLHKKLSDREYQVMCLIATGKTVKQIAVELSLGVSTISTLRGRILKKFDMKTNTEIAHYAVKHGLVE